MKAQWEEMQLPASLTHFSSSWFAVLHSARVKWEIDAGGSIRFFSLPWMFGRICSFFNVNIEIFLPDAEFSKKSVPKIKRPSRFFFSPESVKGAFPVCFILK